MEKVKGRVIGRLAVVAFVLLAALSAVTTSCDKLPDDVSVQDIPAYYHANGYLDSRVEAINKAISECSGECETFFWITDIHWEPTLNARHSPALIEYIASKTGVSMLLNGGDTANSNILCKNAIQQLIDAIGSRKVYTVTGNHEINDASRYEEPFQRVADELRGHCSDVIYGDGDKSYFYFDDWNAKMRYIGLSSFGLYMDNQYSVTYTDEQLSWFRDAALNVDEGWSIVVFSHSLYSVDVTNDKLIVSPSGADKFIDVIENYSGKGIIACVLMGHTHRDRIHIGKKGVPYVISASDRHATYQGDINVSRIPGTISEQHFEVVVIDKAAKKISFFSIGANARDGIDDDPGKEVNVRTVFY